MSGGSTFGFYVEVDPKTVGQFTGLTDKNGTNIFDGDIVGGYPHGSVQVQWNKEYACFESFSLDDNIDENDNYCIEEIKSLFGNDYSDCKNEWEVIGNIYS